jgi:hypothetical protein
MQKDDGDMLQPLLLTIHQIEKLLHLGRNKNLRVNLERDTSHP